MHAERPNLGTFPEIVSENLEHKTVKLPRDFAGERNLVFIAFQREQQRDIDTWSPHLSEFIAADPTLEHYELPVIDRLNSLSRWFINSGMRRAIEDHGARARTISIYTDKKAFEAPLNIESELTIFVMVVDRTGKIMWRTEGPWSQNNSDSLTSFLKSS